MIRPEDTRPLTAEQRDAIQRYAERVIRAERELTRKQDQQQQESSHDR